MEAQPDEVKAKSKKALKRYAFKFYFGSVNNHFSTSNSVIQFVLQVEGVKQFPCPQYKKTCNSKGGLTNHIQRMHGANKHQAGSGIVLMSDSRDENEAS